MPSNIQNDGFDDLRASERQRKAYFSLMKKRGYSGADAKHILKRRFQLESFMDIDKERMSYVIDRLINKK